MIPDIFNLFFKKVNVLPSAEILSLLEKKSLTNIPKLIDLLIDLAYSPESDRDLASSEADRIINAWIDSTANPILLKHLFELQGPIIDEKIKTIKGNRIIKALPQWKQCCYDRLIREIMLKPNGVYSLIKILADLIGNKRTPEVAFNVAKCICKPPQNGDRETYYKSIAEQITHLVQMSQLSKIVTAKNKNNDIHMEYLQFGQCVGLECIHLFVLIDKELARKYLLEPIFKAFLSVLDSNDNLDYNEPQIVIESDSLTDMLNLLNSLLNTHKVTFYVQRWIRNLSPVFISILKAGIDLDIKQHTLAKDILTRLIILSHDSPHDSLRYVRALAQLDSFDEPVHHVHNKLQVRLTMCRQNTEVAVNCNSLNMDSGDVRQELLDCNIVVDVLLRLPTDVKNVIASSLYVWLLEKRLVLDNESSSADLLMPLQFNNIVRFRLFRDNLLCILSSKMEPECFTKIGDILKCAQIVINQYSRLEPNLLTPGVTEKSINENMDYALNMIGVILEHQLDKLTDSDKDILKDLFPVLVALLDKYPNSHKAEVIAQICTIIATKGYVNPLTSRKTLIEEVDDAIDPRLTEAFDEVADKIVSTKALGLDNLRKLLVEKNASALRQRAKIYNIFVHHLLHEESFVYLRAIRGLVLIVDCSTDKLLPVITSKMATWRRTLSLENWLILSEAFIKIIQNLGELASQYRDLVLNCISPQLSDENQLVRASAVSNLGDLCCQLNFASFTTVMYEIISKVCDLLENDGSSQVKVACSIMIRKLIFGKFDDAKEPRQDIMQLHPVFKMLRDSFVRVFLYETNEIVLDHLAAANKCVSDAIQSVPFFADASNYEGKISIGNLDVLCKYRKLNF